MIPIACYDPHLYESCFGKRGFGASSRYVSPCKMLHYYVYYNMHRFIEYLSIYLSIYLIYILNDTQLYQNEHWSFEM